MLDEEQISQLRGATVVAGGDEVGTVQEVFTHSWDDRPALVSVGANGGSLLVPLNDAEVEDDQVTVQFDSETIAGAPTVEGDTLTEDEFVAVYDHYGISDASMREDSGAFRAGEQPAGDPRGPDAADDAQQGHP